MAVSGGRQAGDEVAEETEVESVSEPVVEEVKPIVTETPKPVESPKEEVKKEVKSLLDAHEKDVRALKKEVKKEVKQEAKPAPKKEPTKPVKKGGDEFVTPAERKMLTGGSTFWKHA